jgi:hypothetical protein
MSPSPTLLPCPCGSAPFETHRGSHLCGSRCRDVISRSEGVHAVSAEQCGFGRGVASGPQASVALPLSALLHHRMRCGRCGGSCCGTPTKKPCEIKAVAVLRHDGGGRPMPPGLPSKSARPPFDMGNAATASCLLNQIEHAPDQGGTGGQQSSVRGLLLRGAVSGSMDRGPHPQSMARWRVFNHRVASVARILGSHLAGCRLLAIALSIKSPGASLGHRRPRVSSWRKDRPAHPPLRPA